mgnify:CR=1 FL=1|tara:strand:+ start:200 stop:490 length:291 start_codon:yes stop_codon:yes gene_type:complete
MKKKKSYMNFENILSEGFYSKLFKFLLPKKIKDKLDSSKKKALDKEIAKIDKDIKSYKKQMKISQGKLYKAVEKQTGVKINKKIVDQEWENLISGN